MFCFMLWGHFFLALSLLGRVRLLPGCGEGGLTFEAENLALGAGWISLVGGMLLAACCIDAGVMHVACMHACMAIGCVGSRTL